ncbi:MAG: hypothetical protein OXH52_05980 [Gammaproteobacteria bacterium]|nr:hypothetical protein [Gammaproteobacteria bacterium]
MAPSSGQDVAQLEKVRAQLNRIASAHDQAVLKLSSAGLVVSFAFMRFLGEDAGALNVLKVTWICWLLSTICLIVSFWFGMSASWKRELANRTGSASILSAPLPANRWILRLNFSSGLFYLLGLCAFVVFLFMNTPGGA